MHAHLTSCAKHPISVHARIDPTQTLAIRARYERDLVRRFTAIKQAVKRVMQDDRFKLETNAPADKVRAFMKWLQEQEKKGLLEITKGTKVSSANASWQNVYLRSAYQKGLSRSAGRMRQSGVKVMDTWVSSAFNRPIHADTAGLVYTKAYSDLDGITKAMDTQISRVMADGVIQGIGPAAIAKNIADRIDAIGIARARVLARTSIIGAHAEATLNGYQEADAEGVNIESEFSTSGDNKVCPQCSELEGTTYTIEEARGVIPVHPNCRCAWLPVIRNPKGKVLS